MNEKPKGRAIEGIRKIIEASGYPLEIDIANILRRRKWIVYHQFPYLDKTQKKLRLIDLWAINPFMREPRVSLLIECKKTTQHGWAFHTIKRTTEVQGQAAILADFARKIKGYGVKAKLTDKRKVRIQLKDFHLANPDVNMGTVCCIPDGRDDFHEAVYQVLDALISLPRRRPEVVFPVVVFEGPMWNFRKDNGFLDIHEIDYLQYIAATPDEGSVQLVDIVKKSYFEVFLGLVDGSVEWLRKNLVKKGG
jgi:hypothetical protein